MFMTELGWAQEHELRMVLQVKSLQLAGGAALQSHEMVCVLPDVRAM
jgi:hypothetical protein